MAELDFLYPLPEDTASLLIAIVAIAEENQLLTVDVTTVVSEKIHGGYDHIVNVPGVSKTRVVEGMRGRPLWGLELLGYIEKQPDVSGAVFITQKGYQWAQYQRKSRFAKWWFRVSEKHGPTLLAAFVSLLISLGTLLGWALTTARLIEVIQKIAP